MSGFADSVYPRLPVALQHVAASAFGLKEARIRYGKPFRDRLAELRGSEYLSREELDERQLVALRRLVRDAARDVPFYRGRLNPEIGGRDDLEGLPVLTKEDVRRHGEALISERADRSRLRERHTSGTTGASLRFWSTRESIAFQWAVWWRHRERFGLEPGTWHANFTGKPAVPFGQSKPPYWRWSLPLRQAVLSMQQLTPATAPDVAAFLDRRAFAFWSGYPSVLHAFAASALAEGVELERPPRVVVTGAEPLLENQRRDLERLTRAVVSEQYGLSEGCGNASGCPAGRLHEDTEFGLLESVDAETLEDGRVRGRLLATGFACPEFPLIRYDTGDVGVWFPDGDRCPCGRSSRTLERVEGRLEDYVLTPEGGRIMRFDYLFKSTESVAEVQVVQERPGAILLRIVREAGYGEDDERFLRGEVARWISPSLDVEFDYPAALEREPNGKLRAVKSLLGRSASAADAEIIDS